MTVGGPPDESSVELPDGALSGMDPVEPVEAVEAAGPAPARSSSEHDPRAGAPAPVASATSAGAIAARGEVPDHPWRIADPGQRLLARIVDTLVVGVPVVLAVRATASHGMADVIVAPLLAVALLVYEAVQLALWGGRTLGKRLAAVTVVLEGAGGAGGAGDAAPEGRPPGLVWWRAILRSAVYALPIAARPVPLLSVMAGIWLVVNAAACLERPRRQAGHDRLVGTVVMTRRAPEGAQGAQGAEREGADSRGSEEDH